MLESGAESTTGSVDSTGGRACSSSLSSDATEVYRRAFSSPSSSANPFVAYWPLEHIEGGRIDTAAKWVSRKVFFVASLRALHRIKSSIGRSSLQGVRIAHYMSKNRIEDAILRLAAALSGYSVVTINWDADSPERVKYKVIQTKCAAVFFDDAVPQDRLHQLTEDLASHGTQVISARAVAFESDLSLNKETVDLEAETAVLQSVTASLDHPHSMPKEPTANLTAASERLVVFTSGTTNEPKGVRLSYGNLETSCQCILNAVEAGPEVSVHVVAVNPFHHVNTSVIYEAALRHPNVRIHLIDRYRTPYWKILCLAAQEAAAEAKARESEAGAEPGSSFRLVAPLVSRHIDFLQSLTTNEKLRDKDFLATLKESVAPKSVILFLGSAPVGPSTVKTMNRLLGKMPKVRFGSTETALQVAAVPYSMSDEQQLKVLQRGWSHSFGGAQQAGFYVGRPHAGLTEMRVRDCEEGEPGFLVCRGSNTMLGYANTTAQPFSDESWYLGFGDIAFYLVNEEDKLKDFFWVSRAADVLIKGGANYSCQQISSDLQRFLSSTYGISSETTSVATLGIKWRSEHEDDVCVTVELPPGSSESVKNEIEKTFLKAASSCSTLAKGFKPDFVRVGEIPKTFKGAVDMGNLRKAFLHFLQQTEAHSKHAPEDLISS
ncbi:hypothetical protein Esti_005549 [Eimeria stiedai]